jgi:hypothetical protein
LAATLWPGYREKHFIFGETRPRGVGAAVTPHPDGERRAPPEIEKEEERRGVERKRERERESE